ncbi:IucA/IucC family siderophore biosynthesis protein [Pseudoalteromonas sp.]|uniref:IucA/IucC family protein n=1 Tax=Pseudoalteromonas sp. TaxID=53249 RepID=UPI00356A71A7
MLQKSFSWSSFANAYLRENNNWQQLPYQDTHCICITLNQQQSMLFPLHYFSAVGLHHYRGDIYLLTNTQLEHIEFAAALPHLLNNGDKITTFSPQQRDLFAAHVLQSQAFIAAAVQAHPNIKQLNTGPLTFIAAEQGLLAGHNFHPAAKSREQLAQHDWAKYSPEFGAKFALVWLKVARECLTGAAEGASIDTYLNTVLSQSAASLLPHCNAHYAVLPMHPWQWQYLKSLPSIACMLNDNLITELGAHGLAWSATSSVRAVCQAEVDYQLKFSLNIKLTNSLRTLSVKECQRGLRIFNACQTHSYAQWQQRYPEFVILQEPAWCGLQFNGNVIEESILLFRENQPLCFENETLMLATLCQLPMDDQRHLLQQQLQQVSQTNHVTLAQAAELWFSAFCEKVLVPLCDLQANLGLVCLAHQQNIVIEFAQGLPSKTFIRDCQGMGFSERGIALFSEQDHTIHSGIEHHWSAQQISRYFPYYVIINSGYAVIAALSMLGFGDEQAWCNKLHTALASIADSAHDPRCLQQILTQSHFQCKGNFYCYLAGDNENTLADPAVIYFQMANLVAHSEQEENQYVI